MEQETSARDGAEAMESTEAVQQKVEVPKVDLGSTDTFTREQVEGIVAKALESEITGLKSNNIALKEEKKKAQERAKEFQDFISQIGGQDNLNELLSLKNKIEKDEELRLFTSGDREKYNERILNRARQDHANQLKRINEELESWKTEASTAKSRYQQREIDKSIMDGCADSGVNPRLYRAMSAQVRDEIVFDEETGKVLVRDGEGIRYGSNGQPMEVRELIDMMREDQPELFLQSTGSGAQGSGAFRRSTTGVSAEEMRNLPMDQYKRLREQGVIR
jgi:hypothetical protein